MPDIKLEEQSSTRPEVNVDTASMIAGEVRQLEAPKPFKKRRKWRKRGKRKDIAAIESTTDVSHTVRGNEDLRLDIKDKSVKNADVNNTSENNTLTKNNTEKTAHNGAAPSKRRRRSKRGNKHNKNAENGAALLASQARHSHQNHTPNQAGSGVERGAKKPKHKIGAYAALDLGTNNCRLLVALPQQPGRFKVVDAYSRIVRLGEGLGKTGKLSDAAMDRALGALKACAKKLNGRAVRHVRLIATEACRRATNGAEFLTRVEQETGLKLEIVDRETEARLAVAGCASLVDKESKGVVLFDIGGGSSELALLDLNKRKRHDLAPAVVSWTSLPLGVITLSEKHGGGKKVTRSVFETMVAEVTQFLYDFKDRDALASLMASGDVHLLGTSGTVTTLAGIYLKLSRYDRNLVDGLWMDSKHIDKIVNDLVDMSFEERVATPCIGEERADLVLAGCAILMAIQQFWPCQRLRVADRGLREGLLTEMMNNDNAWRRRRKMPRNGSKNANRKDSGQQESARKEATQ